MTAELASKLENGTSKASAKVVLTEAGTTAIDTLMGITKKTAQVHLLTAVFTALFHDCGGSWFCISSTVDLT